MNDDDSDDDNDDVRFTGKRTLNDRFKTAEETGSMVKIDDTDDETEPTKRRKGGGAGGMEAELWGGWRWVETGTR